MAFTPLTLTCTDHLSSNVGIERKKAPTFMTKYSKLSIIVAIEKLMLEIPQSVLIDASTVNFRNIVNSTFPALLNAVPSLADVNTNPTFTGFTTIPNTTGLTQYILSAPASILELADYSKLASAWGMANAHVTQINEVIKSALASKVQNSTFAGNDAAMTSNIALVTTNIPKFAIDLEKTAELFAKSNEGFTNPVKLLTQISDAKGLPLIRNTLIKNGLSDNEIDAVIAKEEINNNTLKNIYVAFGSVVKEELSAILDLLNIKTEKITSLQDLYNLKVMFPDSYELLIAPTKNGSKSINKIVKDDLLIDVDFIIPQDYAVSLTAFSSSLQQIKGIADLKISAIVKTAKSLENTANLTIVSTATSAVSADTSKNLASKFAIGTGENNTLVFADVLGTSIGYSHDDVYQLILPIMTKVDAKCAPLIAKLNSSVPPAKAVAAAKVIKDNKKAIRDATPTTDPTYSDKNSNYLKAKADFDAKVVILEGYKSQVQTLANSVISENAELVKECNKYSTILVKRITHETKFQADAKIVKNDLQHSNTSVLQFAKSFHAIGNDKVVAGQRTVLTELSPAFFMFDHGTTTIDHLVVKFDKTSVNAAQTIIACMKEGQNIKQLQNNGLATDNFIKI
jgi:hypothetical protein